MYNILGLKMEERRELPKNSVTNSADPFRVIALLSCLVAAIFQNHPIARIDGKEKRRRLELVSNFSHDDPAAVPWVPETFRALFPVAAYVLYCEAARCGGLPTLARKKPLVPRVQQRRRWHIFCWDFLILWEKISINMPRTCLYNIFPL